MADVRSVAVGFWVGTGSRDEPDQLAGASHFLEHLLFKGTPTRGAAAIAEALDEVGGDCNAYTTKEYTAFYVRLLSEHLDSRAWTSSPTSWRRRRSAPVRRRGRAHGDPRRDPDARRRAGGPGIGERWHGGALPRARPRPRHAGDGLVGAADHPPRTSGAFFERHYRPANIVVAAAGDCRHDVVAADLERTLRRDPGRRRADPHGAGPDVVALGAWCAGRPSRPTWSWACARCRALTSGAGRSAVLNHVLGGGLSSRLFQKIREERGLAYSIWSDRAAYADAGSLAVSVGHGARERRRVPAHRGRRDRPAGPGRDHAPGAGRGQGQPALRDVAALV